MPDRYEHYLWVESADPKHAARDDCTHQWVKFNFGEQCSLCEGWRYEVKHDLETAQFFCSCPSFRFDSEGKKLYGYARPSNERTCKHTRPLIENATRAAELHREEVHASRKVTEAELVDVLAHVASQH